MCIQYGSHVTIDNNGPVSWVVHNSQTTDLSNGIESFDAISETAMNTTESKQTVRFTDGTLLDFT